VTLFNVPFSGTRCRVVWYKYVDVSEEHIFLHHNVKFTKASVCESQQLYELCRYNNLRLWMQRELITDDLSNRSAVSDTDNISTPQGKDSQRSRPPSRTGSAFLHHYRSAAPIDRLLGDWAA